MGEKSGLEKATLPPSPIGSARVAMPTPGRRGLKLPRSPRPPACLSTGRPGGRVLSFQFPLSVDIFARSAAAAAMKRSGRGRKRAAEQGVAAAAAAASPFGPKGSPGGAAAAEMVSFCPQCGKKVEVTFNFCPFCGGKLPIPEEEPMQITPTPSLKDLNQKDKDEVQRSPAKKKLDVVLSDKEKASSSVKATPPVSPKAKAKLGYRSPKKDKSAFLRPLPEGEILIDQNSQQWVLEKLVIQNDRGLMYKAKSKATRESCLLEQRYDLKLDVKDGRLFNEQNFFQRAAKKSSVEKWKKQHAVPLLGIPDCLGFGLHNNYRFLVFPQLGRSLQSVLDDYANKMTMKAALQFAVRLLDILEYLHENEYTHGDIAAGNIYVNPADLAMVTLADYCSAYRYSPGGKHVSYRECSRTPHEGSVEFISVDGHKGVAPSRRSDLESLGYCLVKWLCGSLPWSEDLTDPCGVMEQKERYKAEVIKHPRLSHGWKAIPEAVQNYLLQVVSLEYEEKPNYEELRALLRTPLDLVRASPYDAVDLKVVP